MVQGRIHAVQQQDCAPVQYRVVTSVSQAGERSRIQASSVLSVPLAMSTPTQGTTTAATTVTVSGTTAPGAVVDIEGWDPLQIELTSATTTTAGPSGTWSLSVPIGFGTTTITATATSGPGGRTTGYAQTSVTSTALPGTSVFSVTDPTVAPVSPFTPVIDVTVAVCALPS